MCFLAVNLPKPSSRQGFLERVPCGKISKAKIRTPAASLSIHDMIFSGEERNCSGRLCLILDESVVFFLIT